MATVPSSSDQTADLLQNLSLNSETKTAQVQQYTNKGHYGNNSSLMYHQGYSYPPYAVYPSPGDSQVQGMQQYQYPSHYYQSYAPNQANAPQGGVSTSVAADHVSESVATNIGNPSAAANGSGVSGYNGSKLHRPTYQYPYLDPNTSHGRGGSSTVIPSPSYQDPRFNGGHSPVPWVDSKHTTNAGYSAPVSHTNNFSSGRNLNHRSIPHHMNLHHSRPTSGSAEAFDYMNQIYANSMMYGHYGNTFRAASGSFGYDPWANGRGWYAVDNKWGRGNGSSVPSKRRMEILSELSKGPRAKGFKNQNQVGISTIIPAFNEWPIQDNLFPSPDKEKYNKEDFPESYLDAKFFIIKSYTEDDVHKSIKYNMWTSTPNGNKKLDAAYHEAREKPGDCPVFLLFSVNASGQFVGLAEMVGPVDYDKSVEYWHQDKWTGCFPLKWHIIKDVPNSSLRHITLENNENKPVTNSRDTQEVNLEQGIQILKILKDYSSDRSILDDFQFYEIREKIHQYKKARDQQSEKAKQLSVDGKPSYVVVANDKDKDATVGKDSARDSTDEAQGEKTGDVKLEEDGTAAAAVEDTVKESKPVVSSGKKGGASNGAASAC